MNKILRILAGLISFPLIAVAVVAVAVLFMAMLFVMTACTLAFWLVFFMPFGLVQGLFDFALGTEARKAFKLITDTFVDVVDSHRGFRDVVIPVSNDLCYAVRKAYESFKNTLKQINTHEMTDK